MILLILTVLLTSAVLYVRNLFQYWDRKGLPNMEAFVPFGCMGPLVRQKKCFGELIRDLHLNSKESFVGIYFFYRPAILIRDPVLVKRVLIKDFDYFHDRGVHHDEENDPISAGIFSMSGQKWKDIRLKFSPSFSSGKLKTMFFAIDEKTRFLKDRLHHLATTSGEVRLKREMVLLNVSIIANVFYGFELNAFEDPEHEFAKIGDLFFDTGPLREKIKHTATFVFPDLMKALKLPVTSKRVENYVLNLVKSVMEAREADPSLVRNDFIQSCLTLIKEDNSNTDIMEAAAQALVFYLGGYETTAATNSFCIYALSRNREWMEKARQEVDALMERTKGDVKYEDLNDLKVIDMCIKETLRIYPALMIINRLCTREYKVPGTEKFIPKGTPIIISNWGLQMEDKFFPDPEKFDPSRFDPETALDDMPFYPMGAGPRYCMGARMGYMMVRMALCTMIHHFDFEAVDDHLEYLSNSCVLADKNEIHLKIKLRDKSSS